MKKELVGIEFLLFSTTFELCFGYRCIVELLTEAVTFIEKLESHLQSLRSVPQIPHMVNNMVSSKRIEPAVFSSMKNAVLFGCLGYFYVLTDWQDVWRLNPTLFCFRKPLCQKQRCS